MEKTLDQLKEQFKSVEALRLELGKKELELMKDVLEHFGGKVNVGKMNAGYGIVFFDDYALQLDVKKVSLRKSGKIVFEGYDTESEDEAKLDMDSILLGEATYFAEFLLNNL